jgi:hypothetical protein
VKYKVFQINASYIVPEGSGTTRNPLSNTVRFSLLMELDKFERPAPEPETEDKK